MGWRKEVLRQVRKERKSQDQQWGGPEHDDTHTPSEWKEFIRTQQQQIDPQSYRERMVKTAALAVAAVESYDRLKAFDRRSVGDEWWDLG